MEEKEYWYNDTTYINISSNNRIGVTLYYGQYRKFAIKTSADIEPDRERKIKKLLKFLGGEKKHVSPMHGCTHYC